jgi:DNA-binding NarL/FixJ family response regulator
MNSTKPTMKPQPPIRLLLVDDHPMVRDGLRRVTDIDPRLQIVGEAGTVETALARIAELSPEVVLLDVRLAGEDGLEVCRHAKARQPGIWVLCLTSYADDDLVLAALAAGADGYLLKQNDAEAIVEAIQEVMGGHTVFDAAIAPVATAGELRLTDEQRRLRGLSPREWRVLTEVALGRTDKEVAAALDLSVKTVRNYLDRVFGKLAVHTRTEAALIYTRSRGRGISGS